MDKGKTRKPPIKKAVRKTKTKKENTPTKIKKLKKEEKKEEKRQISTRSEIMEKANTPFKTKKGYIEFNVNHDLSIEKTLCDEIITLIHEWEDNKKTNNKKIGNAVFMHIQSHGVEKIIKTHDDLANSNTIEDYVITEYGLNHKELKDLHNYIKTQIRYSSTVPSGYCNILQEPIEPSGINSDTIEYNLVLMYMHRYNNRVNGDTSKGKGLNILFDILRLRKRYFFEIMNEGTQQQRNSDLDTYNFNSDTQYLQKNVQTKISREYTTKLGVDINNKKFFFSPNPGEIDNNLYGIHLFSYDGGELTNAQNLSQVPISPQPLTAIEQIKRFFSFNTLDSRKSEISKNIQEKLATYKQLTLADIFLLGWAIGKKLFMFDPSCNAFENRIDIRKTRANIYPNSRSRGLYGHISSGIDPFNLAANEEYVVGTQQIDYGSQMSQSQYDDGSQMSRGGKKRRKTNKKSKKKRTRLTRRI